MYADEEYYSNAYGGTMIPDEELNRMMNKAGRQIDTLTHCRIRDMGFDQLTPFQKEQILYAQCLLAEFLFENQDELETMLASYGINGVSMTFGGGANILKVQGIIIRSDIYAELVKTGLCYRGLG